MSKVRLTLVGVKPGGVEEEVKNALAELYSKPKSDFETTCQHLFELKKPFVHIDQIDASEAELHRQQLSQIGIESELVGLDLTIDGAQTSKTSDKKPKPKLMSDEKSVDNGGTTLVEKKSGNKALYAVTAVAVLGAFGAGYFANQLGQSEPAAKIISPPVAAVARTPKAAPEPVVMAAAVEGLEQSVVLTEVTPYSLWRSRVKSIDALKEKLDILFLSAATASKVPELLSNLEDPLAQLVGTNYASKLNIENRRSGASFNSQSSSVTEELKQLDSSLLQASGLPEAVDRQFALLELGETFESLNRPAKAAMAYQQAEKMVLQAMNSKDSAQVILAEVVAAEHLIDSGQQTRALQHYMAAAKAARTSDIDSNWAMAFIARSEAKYGQFSHAFNHLEEIEIEQIHTLVMDDIAKYAEQIEDDPNSPSIKVGDYKGSSSEVEIANDPAMMLRIENKKAMQREREKTANLSDQ